MKFGDNLKTLRKKNKISQEALADKVGVSRQSVSKWETGDAYPEMNNILQLCKIFHCNIGELVNDSIVDIDSLDEDVKMKVVKLKEEKQKKVKVLSKIISTISKIGRVFTMIGIICLILVMLISPVIINKVDVVRDKIVIGDNNLGLEIVERSNKVRLQFSDRVIVSDIKNETDIIKAKNIIKNNSKTKLVVCTEVGFIFLIGTLVCVYIMLGNLSKFFKNIHDGDTPFTLDNVKHIKRIAYMMIAVIAIGPFSELFFSLIMDGVEFSIPTFSIIEILVIFTMAYIFEYGYEVQLDSKGKMYGEYKDE
ncbi:MAG: helix-turn-helix domain-containing protein [Bacilli bacterium]|nr:helix-turn-helix domain-containing protein [Bacilli bacterium]